MKRLAQMACAVSVMAFGGAAMADPVDDTLILNEDITMVTRTAAPAHLEDAVDEVLSGWLFRGTETRAMQADDFDNPGMIFVEQAEDVWNTAEGSEGKSCASCHNEPDTMAGVRAVYPKWNEAAGEVRTLEMQINDCRENRMGAEKWKYTKSNMVNMTALLASVSRGMPINVAIDGPAQSTWEQGKELYYTRTGQLELSCANCHEDSYGKMIRADHLSQGQINGFPVYRLKNTKLNAVHARFKGCVRDTRAETYKPGSPEFIALELYVASRGNGLSVEGPSIRN
ncbi:sulfur oxidation c-type cytochrome SoxA [Sulfitobacter mediterraneus]|jgi:L-cysteine S-thiosulfotransferase|uniref:sulfur oxidation c-type cytochrome SoxA n=1 Tax=Sulfitobacter mediterraneus TaxID=83219 RepID=UPI000EA3750A|nr:sulfur oxidation c-type cytochrome SoxA [Sulfitobacter mediterraneus]MBM1311115.1 sulfur oxidation c-type cytochrome SoxA [Sulfitobacter mediterraneus]MBM1314997.1 sulfur oxidation c-type cytochrome SoxA [Sulfitobacter mediterraneus]MBM1323358.1 sulfur oxidation c-type cytochrome SoxA [Sulfitobacter mediterraneus]MBM1327270.1 sulfur oxidation c-type cytochrome SoxA [Sulfitobacter mediterraneus]MBM1398618.1 sulfur oxidation c-type cytochrome SoxA [Sulfitobacter mediterraneus]